MKKLLSLVLSAALALTAAIAVSASDIGECKGEVPKIDTGVITIDGVKDSAYDQGLKVDINQFNTGTETGTYGIAYMLWTDGSYYLLVEVHDADVQQPSADAQANTPWTSDSVEIFFDFGNEAVNLAEQFRIDCTGYPSYYIQGGAFYAYGPEDAAEYFDDYAASKTDDGYNIEMRVNLKEAVEAYELKEGDSIGLQLQINDMAGDANTSSTTAIYNMASSLLAGSWDVDKYDYITLGGTITAAADAPAAGTEAASSGAYPSSGASVPDGSKIIMPVALIGNETGWGGSADVGRDKVFDGDITTYFDPLGVGDGFAGIDAGKEYVVTKIVIHPREGWGARYYGATIQGTNDDPTSDDAEWTDIWMSVEEATEVTWHEIEESDFDETGVGYRYFRYYNMLSHGDVAEVELYGYPVDGVWEDEAAPAEEPAPAETEPEVVETEPEVVETEPEAAEPAEETVETPAADAETEAPQTFDMGVIAAVCAVISAAGYAVAKKRR